LPAFAPADWFELSNAAIGEVKSIRDELPDRDQRAALSERIKKAEDALAVAHAMLANTALGYRLCRSHFPPGIMIESPDGNVCSICKRLDPHHKTLKVFPNSRDR
jgi:hypothetical protein